jgi:lipopolysaccharide transport system permease protein
VLEVLIAPFREILRCRRALLSTLRDEIRRKHAGAVLGAGWLVLMPLMFLAFYAAVFITVYRVKPTDMSAAEYVYFIYIGLMTFMGFSEGLTSGAASLSANRAVLLNTVFPAEMLPLRSVLVGQTTFVIGMVIAVCWSFPAGHASVWMLLAPLVMALQVMFLIGTAWLLSPIYLVFRDLGQILSFAVLGIMTVSPIAYRPESLSGLGKVLLGVNPLYYFLAPMQEVLFNMRAPSAQQLGAAAALAFGTFVLGFVFFRKVKGTLAERV